jgi:hypothetical protein
MRMHQLKALWSLTSEVADVAEGVQRAAEAERQDQPQQPDQDLIETADARIRRTATRSHMKQGDPMGVK